MKIKVTTPPAPIPTVENLPVGTVFEHEGQVYTKVLVDGYKRSGIAVVWGDGYPKKLGVFSTTDTVPQRIVEYPSGYKPPKQPREFVLTLSEEEMRVIKAGVGSLQHTSVNGMLYNDLSNALIGG